MIPAQGWTARFSEEVEYAGKGKRRVYNSTPLIGFGDNGEPYIWHGKCGMCDARKMQNFSGVQIPRDGDDDITAMIHAADGTRILAKWVDSETGERYSEVEPVVAWGVIDGSGVPLVWSQEFHCLVSAFSDEFRCGGEVVLLMPGTKIPDGWPIDEMGEKS